MKYLALLPLLMLCIALPAAGQNYAYHNTSNPSGGSANTFPFGNAFGNNWRYQLSVPVSSMPNTPVRFTELAFAPITNGTFLVKDFQLRMAHANTTTLSSIFANNFATLPINMIDVQGGKYTFTATANRWTPLGVQTGFDWDGKQPLLIEIRYRGIGTRNQGSTNIRCWTSSANSNRVWANGTYPPPGPVDPYAAPVGYNPTSSGAMRVRLTYVTILITLAGNPSPGNTVDLNLSSPSDTGRPYQAASSLGTGPIPIGSRLLGLTPDDLMVISTSVYLPSLFVNYAGKLDSAGKAKARIKIPNSAKLKGVRIHSAFITFDSSAPFGISNISNTATFSIM